MKSEISLAQWRSNLEDTARAIIDAMSKVGTLKEAQ